MSERDRDLPSDEEALERELRDLPAPEADETFRRELKRAFVSGRIESDALRPSRPRRRVFLSLVAAAVVLVTVTLLYVTVFASRPPEFLVFDVAGTGDVIVDGRAIPLDRREELEASLRPGAEVLVPATATLDLVVPGVALLELTGGTRMVLPWGENDRGRLESGEVRFVSGSEFEGRTMSLTTPDGIVRVTGTLLSVQCDEGGTCVCVMEGTVRVGVDEADLEEIRPGSRKVMPRAGGSEISPVAPPHERGVREFLERVADRFERD